ncbi:MAG TPA: hypothetical protein DGG94_09140 [Micromonosporaceae bacterium]|nr:hypothetical protein [Micromonosporaceae bacterium]HCU49948.1 hypothetical protein [Micromonosporaceae bacterium]
MLGLAVWWLTHPPKWIDGASWAVLMALAWLLFAAGAWLVRKVPKRTAAALILLGGIGLPLAAGFAPPRSSDDLYRYIWDGRVQSAGIDPYRYAPAAPELTGLRDDFLWPQQSPWCVVPGGTDREEGLPLAPGCTLINRPSVHTVYPPAAQLYFTAVDLLSPDGAKERPVQLAAALFVAAVTVLLLLAMPRLGIDPRLAALWAWCPLVAIESGNNAHLDVVGAFLTAAALVVLARAKTVRTVAIGGLLLGLAIATKVTPALVAPSSLRRRPFVVASAIGAAIAVVYLPHVIAVGPAVLGYLPGYLNDEGYGSGTRFALLTLIFPPSVAAIAAVFILVVVAIAVWARTDPDRPWNSAVAMTGTALLLTTPGYSWYAILLVLLIAFSDRIEWLSVALAGYMAQYAGNLQLSFTDAQRLGYGIAAAVVTAATLYRMFVVRKIPSPTTALP